VATGIGGYYLTTLIQLLAWKDCHEYCAI